MNQSLIEMATTYQAELDDYKLRFFTKWGYNPLESTHKDFRFLNDKKQKMCHVFWNHSDVIKCTSLIETLWMAYEGCKLIRTGEK